MRPVGVTTVVGGCPHREFSDIVGTEDLTGGFVEIFGDASGHLRDNRGGRLSSPERARR